MNTHESYVSLETARLLRKAGFRWECFQCWVVDDTSTTLDTRCTAAWDWNGITKNYSAPTLAVAQRWLREEKNKLVHVISYRDNGSDKVAGYCFKVYELSQGWEYNYFTYEEALEAGIRKCLIKLLEE